jgi:hypothetical protein
MPDAELLAENGRTVKCPSPRKVVAFTFIFTPLSAGGYFPRMNQNVSDGLTEGNSGSDANITTKRTCVTGP